MCNKRKWRKCCSSLYFLDILLLIMVIFSCIYSVPVQAATVQNVIFFEDLNGHWARSDISRLAALEMVKGYPDHTFKPDQLVNRLETVVLIIRSGGFTAEAEKMAAAGNSKKKRNANSTSSVKTKQMPKVPWGQSYIGLAVEKGFLAPDDPEGYDYAGPVTRLEVAELLARAMYLVPPSLGDKSAPAENDPTTEVNSASAKTLSDLDMLKLEERTLVNAVVNANVMSGYPDGTFRPLDTLTRGEMA
ncbi:S-layer homology domain-containing protein, partial [Pelotomaculum sp. PtaB.Bin117]|uniref:S-layer homology domain-containing protein n=1 Tax=Pelotomaculum sp. PtaB.Bin117 TaxID=1811694 RepID=UPI00257AB00C